MIRVHVFFLILYICIYLFIRNFLKYNTIKFKIKKKKKSNIYFRYYFFKPISKAYQICAIVNVNIQLQIS